MVEVMWTGVDKKVKNENETDKKEISSLACSSQPLSLNKDAHLIAIQMSFDNNHSINTLIDCGSELDIIGHKACMQAQLPIDTSLTTIM